jgi:hypothetical protein
MGYAYFVTIEQNQAHRSHVSNADEPLRSMAEAARDAEGREQASLLRCIFGNPFRPPPLTEPAWLKRHDGTVVNLAQAIYDERRFQDLPILADTLEEAGCTNADILDHCRQPGDHVRGCWVVDLLLGKD